MGHDDVTEAILHAEGREETGRLIGSIGAAGPGLAALMDAAEHGACDGYGPLLDTAWTAATEGDPGRVLSLMGDAYRLLGRRADEGHGRMADPAGGWMRASFHVAKALARGMDPDADADECSAMVILDGDRTLDPAIRAAGGYRTLAPVLEAFGSDGIRRPADANDFILRGFVSRLAGGRWLREWDLDHRPVRFGARTHAARPSRSHLMDGLERLMHHLVDDVWRDPARKGMRAALAESAIDAVGDARRRAWARGFDPGTSADGIVDMTAALHRLDGRVLGIVAGTYRESGWQERIRIRETLAGSYLRDRARGRRFSLAIEGGDMPDGFIRECLLLGDPSRG